MPQEEQVPLKNRIRLNLLSNLDDFLNWTVSIKARNYALAQPLSKVTYLSDVPEIQNFVRQHGFFSPFLPLVGKVSRNAEDLPTTLSLLKVVEDKIQEISLKAFATAEVLSKVLAYRDLKKGDTVSFYFDGDGNWLDSGFICYRVDEIFNLWHGMPAFGLVSTGCEPPLLLFRGTDFSLDSQRGWASMLSDIDVAGPGLSAFERAQPQIHDWLKQVAEQQGKARVMGFSLGGALAAYTYILENDWISSTALSYAFNPPGLPDKVYEQLKNLPESQKQSFVTFVNQGDIVSKTGKLFGSVYQLSIDGQMKPLTAHTILLCGEKLFYQTAVDVEKENQSR